MVGEILKLFLFLDINVGKRGSGGGGGIFCFGFFLWRGFLFILMFEDENSFDVLLVKISLFVILFEKLILC